MVEEANRWGQGLGWNFEDESRGFRRISIGMDLDRNIVAALGEHRRWLGRASQVQKRISISCWPAAMDRKVKRHFRS
jgi:hypothetical protein